MCGQVTTTFFTSANPGYEPFVLPYAASALINDAEAVVEICLARPKAFEIANADAIALLEEWFGPRFRVRRGKFGGVVPNSVRFLETPSVLTEFTYIGDIDILILEPVTVRHLEQMRKTGLPYSNVLRPSAPPRLSGLHFTRTGARYPLPELGGVDPSNTGDEHLLYLQVEAMGLRLPDPEERFRPAHGIHFSLNRSVKRPGATDWGISLGLAKTYAAFRDDLRWRALLPLLDRRYLYLLLLLETAIEAHFPEVDLFTGRPVEYSLRSLVAS